MRRWRVLLGVLAAIAVLVSGPSTVAGTDDKGGVVYWIRPVAEARERR